ncbi:uncharacterized protein AB9W97_014581 isoform 1-T2 [Spinachia spinachia]
MRISLKVIIYLMTAVVGLSSVRGNQGEHENVTYFPNTTEGINYRTGENARITCNYPDSHESNDKFLCKGKDLLNCNWWINITEQEKVMVKGRFSFRDNRRTKYFYVIIHNVSRDDSGTYLCGSSRSAEHVYAKLLLSVTERTKHHVTTRRSDLPAVQTTESSKAREVLHPDLIAIVVVCLLLLLIVVLLFILCKHRPTRRHGSSEQRRNDERDTKDNPGDHQYEEIQMLDQQTRSADTPLSVYATVNCPAEQLHYASVTFYQH